MLFVYSTHALVDFNDFAKKKEKTWDKEQRAVL